ncbi:uncharacterized protein BDZ99DRAFT_477901 [Mytilinidion resinicola]|uniref:Uncharacterized protein n=1 Tax=Mytilinidion resinicola TaxID=574789 RepID=A0A6A6YIP0_9PEZI|nr:uncharacterized protein BDZ99DRAFT_477901 [Mytilinidion resinicola]KAF2808383.1 hypothetical protein BDZ99DRAFT_477901 [Mytilinidion resinicola]
MPLDLEGVPYARQLTSSSGVDHWSQPLSAAPSLFYFLIPFVHVHLSRFRAGPQLQPSDSTPPPRTPVSGIPPVKTDPNAPDKRLQVRQKCIYERLLPGNAYISAHVNRLQRGYYQTELLHEGHMRNVYFVSVHFVFHPADTESHRFKSAVLRVGVHGHDPKAYYYDTPPESPRFLRHAPQLMYGAVSPENLQWNFSLSSSLGISQTPLSASVNPSAGYRSSYKVYDMMSIQGSLRTLRAENPDYDVEDALAVWTLQENSTQRSGLPREFDFVLLVHQPDENQDIYLSVDVDPVVDAWFGSYPQWYINRSAYQPVRSYLFDFKEDVGQLFHPVTPGKGFNFATLPLPLDEYVALPGTVYPTNDIVKVAGVSDVKETDGPKTPKTSPKARKQASSNATPHRLSDKSDLRQSLDPRQKSPTSRHSWAPGPETLNVHVLLEHANSHDLSTRRYSGSPASYQDHQRRRSIRRTRSRTGLKEYGAQQAANDKARELYVAE